MFCTKCGAQVPDEMRFCTECGDSLSSTKFCQYCGEVIDAHSAFCPKCGGQVGAAAQPQQPPQVVINNVNNNTAQAAAVVYGGRLRNRWVAFFLCLFFGVLGFHKFYEGKIGMGILYIFTGGLFVIGWLVDLFTLLFKPNPYLVV